VVREVSTDCAGSKAPVWEASTLKLPSLNQLAPSNKNSNKEVEPTVSLTHKEVEGVEGNAKVVQEVKKTEVNLDDKLNNIIESTKRVLKKAKKHIKYTRNRKTSSQIEILEKELIENGEVSKERMNEIAIETGLRKTQVYKWFWNNKKKTKTSN
jgi:hypothetical protein